MEVFVYFTTRRELSSDCEAIEPFKPFKTFKWFKSWPRLPLQTYREEEKS